MKLHLPKQLFTALLAATVSFQQAKAVVNYAVYNDDTYTYDVVQWTGTTKGGLCYESWYLASFDSTGSYTTSSSTSRDTWGECVTSADKVTLLLDENSNQINGEVYYDIDGVKFSGIIVTADSKVNKLRSNNGSRSITLGADGGHTTIAKNFTLTNEESSSAFMLAGNQTWTVDSGATFTLKTGATAGIIQSGNLTIGGGGTANFASKLSINGSVTVENGGVLSISSSIVNNKSLTFNTGSKLVVSSLEDLTFETTGIDYTAESNSMQHVVTTYHVYSGTGSATGLNQVYIGSTEGDICNVNDNGTISVTENAYVITTGTVTVGGASQSSELSGDIDYFAVGANGTLNIEGSYGELTTGTILATAVGSGVLNLNTDASMVNTLASAYTGSVNINTGVTLQANEYAQLSSATSIAVKKGAVLDFSSNNNGVLTVEFLKTLNSASNLTTEEGGWIKVAGANIGNDFVTEKDTDGYTLDKNFHVAGDLRFNGRGYESGSSYRLKIGSKALKVDGTLKLESKAYLDIEGGSAEISTLLLGHNEQGNPGGLTMTGGSLQLGTIQFNNANNQTTTLNTVDISGGNLEFKTSNAITRGTNTASTVAIGGKEEGTSVTLKATTTAWTLDGSGLTTTPEIRNITIHEGNEHSITLKNVNINGAVTNNATLNLEDVSLNGAVTNITNNANNATLNLAGFTVAANATASISGTGTTTLSGTMTNNGTLNLGAAGQTVTLGHKVVNNGSITLNGTLVIENLDADHFDVAAGTFYSSATNQTTATETLSGYAGAMKYQIISGTVTQGDNFSYNGTYEFDEEKGLLVAGSNADTTRFYVNENIKWGVAGDGESFTETLYTDNAASIYVVGADKTLDLNFGNTNDTHGWNGKIFELHEGAILANSGAEGNTSWQQLYRIDLKGNAKIDASTHDYGFLASGYNESILNLNNYTLEKTGSAAFRMINTSINAGTIKITSGAVQIGAWQAADYDVLATEVDFVLNGGNLTFYNNGNALTAKSISGSGNINSLTSKTGELTLVGNSGTHTITGNIGLNKLNLNGSNSYTLNGSMAIGDQLNVSNGKLELTTGSTAFSTTTLSGGTLQVTSGSMTQSSTFSQTGGILQINGGTVTFGGLFNGTNGTANLMGGNIFFNNTTATNVVKNLDVAGNNASTAQVTLAENVKLQVNQNLWLGNTAAIKLAKDAELKKDNMAIIGTGNTSSVTRLSSGNNNTLAYDSDDHEVTNARIEMTKTEVAELKLKLTGTEVTNAGSGTLKVLNSANTITNLAAEAGNVELNETMRVDGISAKEGRVVSIAAEKTLNMGEGSKVQLSSTDGTNAATLTAKSNSALARLQQDATFTIEDMTLTNTTITAASTETRVNLSNVRGEATLAKGTFGLQMQSGAPQVGMGDASLSYGVAGTPSLTLGATEASLVITVDPSADANGIYQDYTLTFNLDVNLDSDSVPVSGEDWKALVGFEGWLGTMLENQDATYQVADGAAQVAEGNSAPTVSYGYVAGDGGSNVGTLTITIAGLNVPEPTTATLSLLALAALAARRRRND